MRWWRRRQSRDAAMRSRESALREEARRIEAEAANRDKDRFMAAVVHELRTPLAALTNVASLMKSGAIDEQVTGILQRQVGQLARLTDDLFEASRVNVGKFNLQFAPLDLRDVVKHAVEATSMRHQHRRQVVDTRLPDAPVMVEGDRTRLAQVVANLVDNAMKFTPSGRHDQRRTGTARGARRAVVVDSGCGIDPQFLPRIFERFAQGPGKAGAAEGLGLGLAVARELVLAHRGRIEAASERAGARFTVTLPLAAPAA